jgi:hypothetical protein
MQVKLKEFLKQRWVTEWVAGAFNAQHFPTMIGKCFGDECQDSVVAAEGFEFDDANFLHHTTPP